MTKFIPLVILGSALLSGCIAADQAATGMDKSSKGPPSAPSIAQAKPTTDSNNTADPAFIPPSTNLICEPGQPQNMSAQATKPPPPVEAHVISEQINTSGPSPAKPSAPEIAKTNAPVPAVESPLPQPLYEPNQNGIVVLPGRTRASSEEGVANPFDIRLIAFKPVNELKIRVGGVVMGGEKPTAIVNGRPYSANDRWSGFNVVQVRKDALLLERDGVFVLIPRGRSISIKIPL